MIRVFIQNEAGSNQKHLHDEKTLAYKGTVTISPAYPFPYGFILDTTSEDGDNVDCFVITERPLTTGTIVTCEPLGLLEQREDGEVDHNVLAVLPDETPAFDETALNTLRAFILQVFAHLPGKEITVGRLLGKDVAEAHIRACTDRH